MADQENTAPTPRQTVVLRAMPASPNEPPEARFGDRMRDARQQLGLSVEALSRLCKTYDTHEGKGISPPTLGRYEGNDTLPGIRELRLIAKALGVPVQWMVDGDIPGVKGSAQVQALVSAMREFVQYVNSDIDVAGVPVSVLTEHDGDGWRAARLADARKPSGEAEEPGLK